MSTYKYSMLSGALTLLLLWPMAARAEKHAGVYRMDASAFAKAAAPNLFKKIPQGSKAYKAHYKSLEKTRARMHLSADGKVQIDMVFRGKHAPRERGRWLFQMGRINIRTRYAGEKKKYATVMTCWPRKERLQCIQKGIPYKVWFDRAPFFVGRWEVKAALFGKQRVAMSPGGHVMTFRLDGTFASVIKRGKRTFKANGKWSFKQGLLRIKAGNKKYKFKPALQGSRLLLKQRKETMELGLLTP